MNRILDFLLSFIGLLILLPFFLVVAVLIALDSKGGVFYQQRRVGRYDKDFGLLKFRTMFKGSDKKGLLTIGDRDNRVTKVGYYLRKYKLDELPQLINVFIGDMSLVGPRPEVRKYVELYSAEQRKVLTVKPGITDYASLMFRNESELMAAQDNPESYYIQTILPTKLQYSLQYIERKSFWEDFKIILLTLKQIVA
ncbi:glycosyl transferase [Solitalea longa]|uniref:Glycosyl transferase n=1 Tax=Solitalea longa TaxID=2079460 RepID=A0A2S4ZZR6_9SPHI|nr:sugar transferase [Solitalea longa]POY35784.1 glycosyl transferase [Solitalea longa]